MSAFHRLCGKETSLEKKLLAMDLDGTILDSDGVLHEESMRALNMLRAHGHVVSYATGRREYDMVNFQYLYDCTDYVILNTGSIIEHRPSKERFYEKFVDPQTTRRLINVCNANGWQLYVVIAEGFCLNIMTDGVEEYIGRTGVEPIMYRTADDLPLDRIEGFMTARDSDEILAYIRENDLPLDHFNSEPGCFDLTPRGISKWNGICILADHLNIPIEDIVTMGNWLNDMEMVKGAGIGIAVADAAQELKDAADYVTQRDHDHDPLLDVCRDIFNLNAEQKVAGDKHDQV